jgi:ankyrin repeat protein
MTTKHLRVASAGLLLALFGCAHQNNIRLYHAATAGTSKDVSDLLAKGGNANFKDPSSWTPWSWHAWTPLTAAASNDHPETVKLLLDHGGNANARCPNGMPVLEDSVLRGHTDIVRLLLEHGADANASSSNKGPTYTPVMAAVNSNHPEIVKLLLDYTGDANARYPNGATLLTAAATLGNADIVRLLLEHGADANLPSSTGYAPIVVAIANGKMEILKLLVDHGADVNLRDATGFTPVIDAAYYDRTEMVKFLIDRGANVLARSNSGVTALTNAKAKGNGDIVNSLLAAGADPALLNPATVKMRERHPAGAVVSSNSGVAESPPVSSDVDRPRYKLPENPNDFALVIGIDKYKSLPEAKYAERDAMTVRDHLIARGYPRRNVVLLTGDNATRTGIQKYLEEWLPRNVSADSTVFFYYSGHGAPDLKTGESFLVPWDGDASFLQSTAYPKTQLYSSLGKLKARKVLVALDSCFSGAGGHSVLADGARPLVAKVDMGIVPKGPLIVFSAASGNEITGTIDEQGHGMFTYYLLKGISGAAKDDSGVITTKSLFDYLKPHVQDEARRQNREQTPLLLGSTDSALTIF